jgi:hypothetical protein
VRGKVLLAAVVGAVAVAAGGSQFIGGACGCATPQFAGSGTGNLWIVTSGGSNPCTRQSPATTLASAASTAKCSSPQAAQNAAAGGDTVMIQDGTYGTTFSIASGTTSSAITYQADGWTPPTDAVGVESDSIKVVYTGGIDIDVDKVHIKGVSAAASPNSAGSGTVNNGGGSLNICDPRANCTTQHSDVLIQGFHGKSAFINGSGVTVDLSEFGGFDDCSEYTVGVGGDTEDTFRFWSGAPNASDQMSNDTLKRSTVHDEIMGSANGSLTNGCGAGSPSTGPHTDCFQSAGGTNMTIDSVIFYNCPEQDFQWNPFSGQPMNVVTVENSYFGPSAGSVLSTTNAFGAIGNGGDCSNINITSNVMYTVDNGSGCTTSPNMNNNIVLGAGSSCGTNTHTFNAFASAWTTTCGTNSQHCNPTFVSSPPGYSLGQSVPNPTLSGSDTCARSHGNTVTFPPTDLFGNSRPLGTVDIGASEVN